MTSCVLANCVLANVDMFREAARHMQRSGSWASNGILLGAVAVLLMFWGGLVWVDRIRKERLLARKSPLGLFTELCRMHHLSRSQRQLLAAAAPSSQPEALAQIFVDPSILRRLAERETDESPEFAELLQKLFGEAARHCDAPEVTAPLETELAALH